MAANAPVGGLYVEVKLDAKQAMAGFDQLKAKGTDVITSLGAVSSGISRAIANEVAKSEKELKRLGQVAQQQAQIVNASFKTPKAPKTPLGKDTSSLRSDIKQSGITRDFLNDLGATGDLAGLRAVQAKLKALQDQAQKIRVNAVDPSDIAEADKLAAKLAALDRAAQKQVNRVTGAGTTQKTQQGAQQALTKTTQAAKQTSNAVKDTTKQFDKAAGSGQQVATAALNLGANLGGVVGALKTGNIGFAINYVFAGLARAFTSLGSVGPVAAAGILAVVAAGAAFIGTAALVIGSLKAIGTAGITSGNQLQGLEVVLSANLGTGGAERELEFLRSRAESSVFDIAGLAEVDRTLVAYNVLNDEVRNGLLDTIITLGTVQGKTVDQLQLGALALGQVYAAGRLQGPEVRQLVDSLGVGLEVFQELPKYADKSTAELKRLQEQGLLPASDFFDALGVRAGTFGTVAAQAASTVTGQLSKIREDLPADIGLSFLEAGVQDQLTNLLSNVYTFLSSLDFAPIAEGFATVIKQLDNAATGFLNSGAGAGIKLFIEAVLPGILTFGAQAVAAFESIGVALRPLIEPLQRAYENFQLLRGAGVEVGGSFNPLLDSIGLFAKGIVFAIQLTDGFIDTFRALIQTATLGGEVISQVYKAIRKAATGDFEGAAVALKKAQTIVQAPLTEVANDFVKDTGAAFAEIDAVIADAKKVRREAQDEFTSPVLGRFELPQPTGLSEEDQDKIKKALEERQKFFDDLAKKLEEARKQLEDLTVRWFGLRSELETGFLGDEGFTATADQIASTGRKVIEILRGVGQFAVAADIDRSTRRLIDLARLRDDFAERLKDAEKKLEDAISSRDGFAKKIREQSIAFVNAFKLEEEQVEKITSIASNGIVGYLVSKTKETKSFVQTLRERVATLREFRANINQLAARGLDAGLLEQLVSAGPEQAGDIVKQLSQSGDGIIREVNAIQKEVGELATEYSDENGKRFYQAGVDTAQAQADGLRFGLKAISAAAGEIVGAVYDQISRLASVTGEIGLQAANALAKALATGAQVGLFAVAVAAQSAEARARVAAQVSARVFDAALIIESEYARRIRDANARENPIQRAVGLATATVFRASEYAKLNTELDRLSSNPQISVYIGQEQIDAIVRTKVSEAQRDAAVAAGTRR